MIIYVCVCMYNEIYVYIYNSYTLIVWTDEQLPKIILETHTEPLC